MTNYKDIEDLPPFYRDQARRKMGNQQEVMRLIDLPGVPQKIPVLLPALAAPVAAAQAEAIQKKPRPPRRKKAGPLPDTDSAPDSVDPGDGPADEAAAATGLGQRSYDKDGTELYIGAGSPQEKPRNKHIPGRMNATERRYSEVLNVRIVAEEVVWWRFESVKFRIGHNCYYTPDFLVQMQDGSLEIHETKGFMRDDARAKLSVMKEMYPFPITLCRWTAPNKKKGITGRWDLVPA